MHKPTSGKEVYSMDYETLRHAADSWGLLYLTVVFVGIVAYTFRPGSKAVADDMAKLPLREDDHNG
jgi:cytochrome c oxidase cbb3-type subunit 4